MKSFEAYEIPPEGLKGLRQKWKQDLVSGFLVSLIALPLCLAISIASGFPPVSGIITAIIGGLLVTLFQGSYITIKGPAAGMIAIVLGAVTDLGYETTLAVIVVSGFIQMSFGAISTGKLGDFFPSSTVYGMLAAIGVMLASKQVHTLVGVKPEAKDTIGSILEIPHSIMNMNPEVALIGFISLVLLFCFPLIKNKYLKVIPIPILVLLLSISLGYWFALDHAHTYLFSGHTYEIDPMSVLVPLPENALDGLKLPNFGGMMAGRAWYWVVMFALVGSLESLLSTKAIDILDPFKRKSSLNKDLFAVGLGNIICGFLGALPMISEIVRSSANVNNGGKTKWSNFFHGICLLLFIALFPAVIRHIPMAALSAMLIFIGYRLASFKAFVETYKVGKEQLLIFITTLVVTLATDLIIGIFSGIVVKFIVHIVNGAPISSLFKSHIVVENKGSNNFKLNVNEAAVFSNYLGLKKTLDSLPSGSKIEIDFSNAKLIDHTTMEHIHHYGEDYAKEGGQLKIVGLEKLKSLSVHPLSYRIARNAKIDTVSRASYMKDLAQSMNYSFKEMIPAVQSNYGKTLKDSKVSVKYEANVLTAIRDNRRYTISDISLVEGGGMKAQISQITVLSIAGNLSIPTFYLKEEVIMDKIMDKTFAGEDIDFKEFPEFSNKYNLKGANKSDIRQIFDKKTIEFIENNSMYCVESLGNEIIVFKPGKMLNPTAIKEMLDYGNKLLTIISGNKVC